ncbi:metallophosphoesterase family protein [Tindallia californiensis]|uniref:Phosphoesterase n=1 Tax=Tindallia californiensis TaxID=159292 RepID=A0A1H3KHD3_9FIRM|nr:metallophosphoesterase [Tindallia californiensis]SDY51459.1 hypothetical protein SAMN05192546_102361 [Tindallia californiensis]
MKIGILGDTHGDIGQLKKALDALKDCEKILHTGDYYHDISSVAPSVKQNIMAVAGNCDRELDLPTEKIIKLHQHTILLCHGHRYGVKTNLQRLYYKALESACTIAVFGHTHVPTLVQESGIYLVNPGSATEPRINDQPTCLRLDLNNPLSSEFITISA